MNPIHRMELLCAQLPRHVVTALCTVPRWTDGHGFNLAYVLSRVQLPLEDKVSYLRVHPVTHEKKDGH